MTRRKVLVIAVLVAFVFEVVVFLFVRSANRFDIVDEWSDGTSTSSRYTVMPDGDSYFGIRQLTYYALWPCGVVDELLTGTHYVWESESPSKFESIKEYLQ